MSIGERASASGRIGDAGQGQHGSPFSPGAADSGSAWPLTPWMSLLADLAAASDLAGFWKSMSVLLESLAPYRTAIAWNDWTTVVFGEAPASPASGDAGTNPHGIWRNRVLALAPLYASGAPLPQGPFAVSLSRLSDAEGELHRLFQPTGWEQALVIPLSRRGDVVRAGVTLFRGGEDGAFASETVARVRAVHALLEALARRVLEQDRQHVMESSVMDVLDDLSVGLLLLDWELRPVFGNTQGYRQTRRWNQLSAPATQVEDQDDFHLPDELRTVCLDLRQRWMAKLVAQGSSERVPQQDIRHPVKHGFKATVEVPQQHRDAVGAPSFLIRYSDMASRAGAEMEPTAAQLAVLAQLTPGERNVALLVMQGKSNREIAAQLHREISTVKDHLSHIYDKFGIRSRTQLVALPSR